MTSKGAVFTNTKPLIYTDLDGSLLDHYSYSADPAKALLVELEEQGVPVIFITSKTFAEVQELRKQLGNRHPFIVENGAAIYLPDGYFSQNFIGKYQSVDDCQQETKGYQCVAFCQSRCHWQRLLSQLDQPFKQQFKSFKQLGDEQISSITGLSLEEASRANQRGFSEPLQWLGESEDEGAFISEMERLGARVLKGGRFLHISGACSKGSALQWLTSVYQNSNDIPLSTIAIGDSGNDIAMLEAADQALVIRSPVHSPPQLKRKHNVWYSEQTGPAGWVEGLQTIFRTTHYS